MDPVKNRDRHRRAVQRRSVHSPDRPRPDRPGSGRTRSALDRLTGGSSWGRFDVWPSRYGFTHVRLIVLPPGTNRSERTLLALWRSAPVLAALAGFGALLLGDLAGLPALGARVLGLVAASAALGGPALASRRLRPLVRTRLGGVDDVAGWARCVGDTAEIERWSAVLIAADAALRTGAITVPQHEVVWSEAWCALAPRPAARV